MNTIDPTFRLALGEYESKNYKKSLSLLEKLIKKKPSYGCGYALKALVLANSGSRYRSAPPSEDDVGKKGDIVKPNYANYCPLTPETTAICEELILKAQKYGSTDPMASHICALYYRNTKNYEKAANAYAQAIANRNGNFGILRDLASCMSQIRIFSKLPNTRFQYLQAEPGYRANYTSTATAYDLVGNPEAAVKICDQIEEIIKEKLVDEDKYENSEMAIYKGLLLAQYAPAEALIYVNDLLKSDEKFRCYDTVSLLQLRVDLLFQVDSDESFKDAQKDIRRLIKINPDNIKYYYQLFKSLKIEKDSEKKLKVCEKLSQFYPKSDIPKFLPLTFLNPATDAFSASMSNYLRDKINRGVPAVFSALKPLYKIHSIRKVVESIVLELEDDNKKKIDTNAEGANPLTLTWIKYFLAQHYYQLKDFERALNKIDEAISITPTLIETHMYKARILKKKGLLTEASNEMNIARKMDLQDRFVNSRCTKYYLRADQIKEAIDTISIFTKNDDAKTGIRDLHVMQSCWFVSELADSLNRLFKEELKKYQERDSTSGSGEEESEEDGVIDPFHSKSNESQGLHLSKVGALLSLAIQRYISLIQIYKEYQEDQFDFHHYAFRKGTTRAYLEMISWADGLMKQSMMGRAYSGLMDVVSHLRLFGSENDVLVTQTALIDLGYVPVTREGKSLGKKLSGTVKKSKKDKRDEAKWREIVFDYSRVDDTDQLGIKGAASIFIDEDKSALDFATNEVKPGRDAGVDPNFVFGEWEWEALNGKWVIGLASIRKMNAIGDKAKVEKMISRTNEFVEGADPKLANLVKMGLMRL